MAAREKFQVALDVRGWSTNQLHERSGVAGSTIRAWLTGQNKNINLQAVVDACRSLGISLDWVTNDHLPDSPVPDWAWLPTAPPPPAAGAPLKLRGADQDLTAPVEERISIRGRPKKKAKPAPEPAPADGTSKKSR